MLPLWISQDGGKTVEWLASCRSSGKKATVIMMMMELNYGALEISGVRRSLVPLMQLSFLPL